MIVDAATGGLQEAKVVTGTGYFRCSFRETYNVSLGGLQTTNRAYSNFSEALPRCETW